MNARRNRPWLPLRLGPYLVPCAEIHQCKLWAPRRFQGLFVKPQVVGQAAHLRSRMMNVGWLILQNGVNSAMNPALGLRQGL